MIQILLVDDQHIIRQGLKTMLESNNDMEIVGEAENGQRAIEQISNLEPDIILMDIRMPVMDGVAATREILKASPDRKILILTTFDDDEYVSQAMRLGAKGYLLKDTEPDELAMAIRAVYKGHTHLGPGLFEKALILTESTALTSSPSLALAQLPPRELEVLKLIAEGSNNREIAEILFLSENTVKNYVTNILSRLNLRDRTQAALFAHSLFRDRR
ncbi:response regulator transcription factor [Pseudanabaena sp. 'Roaring Creek']|uniref:response regulator transcription factor n=1 Tax=Pseudanabaena sp. 'Roaring Creek' TaxID=1681830 RepID=UPI0006D82A71|nr:response regulator transcription factor [Pseudanabaena sp. 'Roaring Creek']